MVSLSQQNNNDNKKPLSDNEGLRNIKNKRAIIEIFVDKYLDYYFQNYENTK